MDGRDVGHGEPLGEDGRGLGDEPVVAVDEVVSMLGGQRLAGRAHVVVHLLHPRDEAVQLARPTGLAHAVNAHATGPSGARPDVLLAAGEAAGEHVHFHALADKRFSELANVSREPALDHGRVLPREEQHAVAHWCTLPRWTVAPHDPRGSEIIA